MATTKKTTVTKKASNKKQVTNNKKQVIPVSDGTETKVMCPVCGTEFAIGEHEHEVEHVVAIGKDSGLGTVYMPVQKRAEALNAAGISAKKYFSMNAMDGSDCLMTYDDAGRPVPVDENDPIIRQILGGGTVPNRKLFRRWIMSQTFHGLTFSYGYAKWLEWHGYDYTWEMLVEELRVQDKLHKNGDMENFHARNCWFNQHLALAMAHDYIKQVQEDACGRKTHKCKGVPYVKFDHHDVFVTDIEKKIIAPVRTALYPIAAAKTPQDLYVAVRDFKKTMWHTDWRYKQCAEWKDAYKGMGAYATMQNLLRFHGCTFPKGNEFYRLRTDGLTMLERAAVAYKDGEGWRLFGLMKQMIEENHIDIEAKMKEWAQAKRKTA